MQISSTNLLVASQAAGYLPNGRSVSSSGRGSASSSSPAQPAGDSDFAQSLKPQKATDGFSPLSFRSVDARTASVIPTNSSIEAAANSARNSGKYLPPGSIVDITV